MTKRYAIVILHEAAAGAIREGWWVDVLDNKGDVGFNRVTGARVNTKAEAEAFAKRLDARWNHF